MSFLSILSLNPKSNSSYKLNTLFLSLILSINSFGQLVDDVDFLEDITPLQSSQAQTLINTLFGSDVSSYCSNITMTGGGSNLGGSQIGFFTDMNQALPSVICDFSTGIVFTTGYLENLSSTSNSTQEMSNSTGSGSDTDFDDGTGTYDVATIEFDLTISSPAVFSGDYFFASDEYLRYVDYGVNDAAKIFVDGTNYALTASGTEVSIDQINPGVNNSQYVDNAYSSSTIAYEPNGFTVKLTFNAPLSAGTHRIKIGITDRGDALLDSWFFFVGNSFVVLPIELVDFSAERIDQNQVQLAWRTLSETNNDYFRIEHSRDIEEWELIDIVQGKGTSIEESNYSYVHQNASPRVNYYRLVQVDFDGSETISEMVTVLGNGTSQARIFPNPSSGLVSVDFSGSDKLNISVHNPMGRLMLQKEISKGGTFEMEPGTYIVTMVSGSEVTRQKLIIQ
ncbi:MAG: hypothetical protein COA38_13605 [Fluviicola sp.]|nr:MAG: hypothetical protein COA38_13605 [Fluviicola sp.]